MYHYFVSYFFSGSPVTRGIGGVGSCEVKINKPITHMEDIQDICNDLSAKKPALGGFTVINYQLLREEPDAE